MPFCFLKISIHSTEWCLYLSTETDTLKVKPHHHINVTAAPLVLYKPQLFYSCLCTQASFLRGKKKKKKQRNDGARIVQKYSVPVRPSYNRKDTFNRTSSACHCHLCTQPMVKSSTTGVTTAAKRLSLLGWKWVCSRPQGKKITSKHIVIPNRYFVVIYFVPVKRMDITV